MNKKIIKDLCILFILYILVFFMLSYVGKFLFKNFYNYYYTLFVKYNGIFGILLFLMFIIIFYLFYSKDLKIIFIYKKLNFSVIIKGMIYLSSITMIYYIIQFIFDNAFFLIFLNILMMF